MISKKNIALISLIICCSYVVKAQYGIGLYHLGSNVVQTNHMNAAFVPQAKLWIGLPLSGTVDFNSSHSFSEYFTKSEGRQQLDYDKILRNAGKDNATILNARLNTFSLGYHISDEIGAAYFFTNEKFLGFMSYPEDVITLIAKGNVALLDEEVKLSDLRFSLSYFREVGLGYTFRPTKGLSAGIRIKYLTGIGHVGVDKDAEVILKTKSNNFETTLDIENAVVHTAAFTDGVDPIAGAGNGYALDLGLEYEVNRLVSLNIAVNDFGRISWTRDITNYELVNSNVGVGGVDLDDLDGDILNQIEDSLVNSIGRTESNTSYETSLHTNIILGSRVQIAPKHEAYFTASNTLYFGNIHSVLGLGYGFKPKDWIRLGVNAVKPPQQIIDFGGSVVLDFGAFQGFLAVDKTLGYTNVSKATGLDVNFGVNLIFGRPRAKKSDQYESKYDDNYWDLDPLVRPDKDVKVGHKYIYDIVQKGDPPAKWKFWLNRKGKKIKKIHARGRKPKSTRNGLK